MVDQHWADLGRDEMHYLHLWEEGCTDSVVREVERETNQPAESEVGECVKLTSFLNYWVSQGDRGMASHWVSLQKRPESGLQYD